jgi:hypothetical protein
MGLGGGNRPTPGTLGFLGTNGLWAGQPTWFTREPPARGSPTALGFDARAIARWNYVPHQLHTKADGPFNVGLLAHHIYGIEKVEFSVHGGPWFPVFTPTFNPQSETLEYWIEIDPAELPEFPIDGSPAGIANYSNKKDFEIRAIIYPKVGRCRVLGGPRSEYATVAFGISGNGSPGATATPENEAGVEGLFPPGYLIGYRRNQCGEHGMFFSTQRPGGFENDTRNTMYVEAMGDPSPGIRNGSQANPFRSIFEALNAVAANQTGNGLTGYSDYARILLKKGDHFIGRSWSGITGAPILASTVFVNKGWTIIEPDPDAIGPGIGNTGQVRIVQPDTTTSAFPNNLRRVKFKNIVVEPICGRSNMMFNSAGSNTTILGQAGRMGKVWFDHCQILGPRGSGRLLGESWNTLFEEIYYTDCYATEVRDAFINAQVVRNCRVGVIGSDAFTMAKLVSNGVVERFDNTAHILHCDLYQTAGTNRMGAENIIVSGVRCIDPIYGQGIFSGVMPADWWTNTSSIWANVLPIVDPGLSSTFYTIDRAFINVNFTSAGAVWRSYQIAQSANHTLLQNCNIGGSRQWRNDQRHERRFTLKNIVARNCTFWDSTTLQAITGPDFISFMGTTGPTAEAGAPPLDWIRSPTFLRTQVRYLTEPNP